MIGWMVYATGVGVLVALATWGLERVAQSIGWPTRTAWVLGLSAALVIPLIGKEASVTSSGVEPLTVATEAVSVDAPPAFTLPGPGLWDVAATTGWAIASLAGVLVILTVLLAVAKARQEWSSDWVGATRVLVSRRFGPALVGVTKPEIVIPSWAMGLGQARAAIIAKHEDQHRRGHDHLLLLYGGVAAALMPWNAAVWWLLSRLRAAVEVDCDSRTLAEGISVREYGHTLLEVSSKSRRSWGFQPGLTESTSLLERRLRQMGRGRVRMSRVSTTGLMAASAALILIACETPAPTNIQDAFDRVATDRLAPETDQSMRLEGLTSSGDTIFVEGRRLVYPGTDPLIFIDGVLVEPDEDARSALEGIDPDAIDRIEVVKGTAAGQIVGDRGEKGGAIFIFLKEGYRPGDQGHPGAREALRRTMEESRRAAEHAQQEALRAQEIVATRQQQELYQAQELTEQLRAVEEASRAQELYTAQQMSAQLRAAEQARESQRAASAEDAAQLAELEQTMRRLQERIEALAAEGGSSDAATAELRVLQEQLRELIRRREHQFR